MPMFTGQGSEGHASSMLRHAAGRILGKASQYKGQIFALFSNVKHATVAGLVVPSLR